MKYFKLLFGAALLCLAMTAQSQFYAYGNLSSRASVSGNVYNITIGSFNGGYRAFPGDNYDVTDIADGMVVWLNCVRLPVTDVVSTSPLVLQVTDSTASGALSGIDLYGYRIAILQEAWVGTTPIWAFGNIADGNAGAQAGISPTDGGCVGQFYGTKIKEAIESVEGGGGAPSGSAGGDLTGTYPNPTIAAGAVDYVHLSQAVKDSIEDVSSFPVATNITASERLIMSGDSSIAFQKITNQLRDSTITGVANIAAIMNLPTTTPEFSRIMVRSTGAVYVVRDSVDMRISDTIDNFTGATITDYPIWKSDTTYVVKIKNTNKYAVYAEKDVYISQLPRQTGTKTLQRAIDFSYWTKMQYRDFVTGAITDTSITNTKKVIVDIDLTCTDTILLRPSCEITGLEKGNWYRYNAPFITVDLSNANKSFMSFDCSQGGCDAYKSISVNDLHIKASSSLKSFIEMSAPINVNTDGLYLYGNTSKFAEYALITSGAAQINISNIMIRDVQNGFLFTTPISTTAILSDIFMQRLSGSGIIVDSAAMSNLYINRITIEDADSSIIKTHGGCVMHVNELHTEICSAKDIIQLGIGGGSPSEYTFRDTKIQGSTFAGGRGIYCEECSGLTLENMIFSNRDTFVSMKTGSFFLRASNVRLNDVKYSTSQPWNGVMNAVVSSVRWSFDNVVVEAAGYVLGTMSGTSGQIEQQSYVGQLTEKTMTHVSTTAGLSNILTMRRSRGSSLVPATTSSGDFFGLIAFQGVNTANTYGDAARIDCFQNGTSGSSFVPGRMRLYTARFDGTYNTNQLNLVADGSIGIGVASPATSALLDITSTSKGVLMPRMTVTQRNAISSPATGLQVYNTSQNKFNFYNGSAWRALVDSTTLAGYLPLSGGTLTGNLLFTDNTLDIGASGATRPRTGYFGTSVISPLFNATTGFQIGGSTIAKAPFTGTLVFGNGGTSYTHSSGVDAYYNTIIGVDAANASTTSNRSVAVGYQSLYSATTLAGGVAIGYQSAYSTTTGSANTSVGRESLYTNTTGINNTSLGFQANYLNLSANLNTGVGYRAMYSNSTGDNNTAVGNAALYENTSGSSNTAVGSEAGRYISGGVTANTTGSSSLFLGSGSKASADGQTNQIVIGPNAVGIGSNSVVLGDDNVVKTALKGKIGIGTTSPDASAALDVTSTTGGILMPRMTATQASAITPVAGLVVYVTDTNGTFTAVGFWGYVDDGTAAWEKLNN